MKPSLYLVLTNATGPRGEPQCRLGPAIGPFSTFHAGFHGWFHVWDGSSAVHIDGSGDRGGIRVTMDDGPAFFQGMDAVQKGDLRPEHPRWSLEVFRQRIIATQ